MEEFQARSSISEEEEDTEKRDKNDGLIKIKNSRFGSLRIKSNNEEDKIAW
jgi:hypothetical protein